jgi:hypothetical protein
MGLKDRYSAPTGTPAQGTPPPASPVSVAPSPEKRDIAAIRAKLAAGGGGNVNPPEMAEALKPEAFEPKTVEGPDGEPVPIVAAEATSDSPPTVAPAAGQAKRTRRTKAEMEAARAAEAEFAVTTAAATVEAAGLVVLDQPPPPQAAATLDELVQAIRRLIPEGAELVVHGAGPF